MAKITGIIRSRFKVWVLLSFILISSCSTPSILVTQEQQAGDMLFNQHNYSEAITHYKTMLNASKQLGVYRNLSMEADVHRKISNSYVMQGQYDKAEQHVRLAYSNDSVENNTLTTIEDQRMLGKIDLYRGNNFEAINSFELALALSDGMDESLKNLNKNSIAENKLALGQLYATMGRFDKALAQTGSSLNLFTETDNKRGEMEALLTMASIHYNYGDLDLSKVLTERSKVIAEQLDLSPSRHLNNLARISSSSGEYEDAIRYEELALSSANEHRIAAQRIWFTVRLGDIYNDLGDTERSIVYYKKARDLMDTILIKSEGIDASLDLREGDLINAQNYFSAQGSDIGSGITLLRLADIAIKDRDSEEAFTLLKRAELLFQKSKNKLGIGNVSLQLGISHSMQKEYSNALIYLDKALEYKEFPELHWQSLFQKGKIYEAQKDYARARDLYIEAISVIEQIRGNLTIEEFKSSFINNKVDVYDSLISLYLRLDQPLLALDYTERAKARSFFEMLANRRIGQSDNQADSLIVIEQDKRFEIQQLYKHLQNTENISEYQPGTRDINRAALSNELEVKQAEHSEIILRLKLFNPEYSEIVSFAPVNHQKIMSGLNKETALITYWVSGEELLIWCIDSESITHKSVKISDTDLGKKITDARTHIATNATTLAAVDLEELYSVLIKPVEENLEDIKHLVIVPNKSLHFLPFQALRQESGDYLVSDFYITYEPSLSVHNLKQGAEVNMHSGLFGAALADVAVGLNIGLPGTEDELNKIIPLFEENLSSFGEQSTESFVKENIGKYNYIHLATHGVFNFDQPAYSFLLFPPDQENDGRLTVYEVMDLELDSRLVTLSACETGLGYLDRGDEIVGLSRSFLYAGSSAVIVSLWSVADYQTSLLMSKFYGYIKDYSLEESLALAQRDLIKDFPNPFFWSPFILIGNGN